MGTAGGVFRPNLNPDPLTQFGTYFVQSPGWNEQIQTRQLASSANTQKNAVELFSNVLRRNDVSPANEQ